MKRLVLVLAGVLLGLLGAEGILRWLYVELPSLDALRRSPYASTPFLAGTSHAIDASIDCEGFIVPRENRNAILGTGEHSMSLWAVGDSMTWGMGVAAADSYVHQLARRLASERQAQVTVRNLAMPGAGFCQIVRQLNTGLQDGMPDVVLMGLFADDLEHRAWVAVDGETIGIPSQITHPTLRWWARRSHVVNLVWFAIAPRTAGARRFVDEASQAAIVTHLRTLKERFEQNGTHFVVALLAPVGFADCPPDAPADDRCGWMTDDLVLLRQLLDTADIDAIDLRTLWQPGEEAVLPQERNMPLPIHPNADGHTRIADAIWPHLSAVH